jgi:hypothetical protein
VLRLPSFGPSGQPALNESACDAGIRRGRLDGVLHCDDRRRGRADRLLFVAVSINLALILKGSKLRSAFLLARAAETLATLLLVVTSSALVLVPQNTRLLGLEIAIVVVPMLRLPPGLLQPGLLRCQVRPDYGRPGQRSPVTGTASGLTPPWP